MGGIQSTIGNGMEALHDTCKDNKMGSVKILSSEQLVEVTMAHVQSSWQRWAHLERERIWNGFRTGTGTAKNPFPFLPLALGHGQERIAERTNNGHRTVPPRSGAPTNHGKSVPAVPTRSYTVIFPFLFRS